MPGGRPSKYTPSIAARIVEAMERGRGLTELCDVEDWAPSYNAVMRWAKRYPEFALQIEAARASGAYAIHEKARRVVEQAQQDMRECDPRIAASVVQAARNVADVYIRSAAALNRNLSDKHRHTLEGPDGGPVSVELVRFDGQAIAGARPKA